MPRIEETGTKSIQEYAIYHGWDQDVHKWFVEVQIPKLGCGYILEWFSSKSEYHKRLSEVL